jgi:NitT/TauT family transport system ATP-binding protein
MSDGPGAVQAGGSREDFITIEQVMKHYETKDGPVHALGPVDLAVRRGEFLAIVGPSGCGKSTMLLLVAGLLEASAGRIIIGGTEVRGPHTDVGIVFQTPALADWRDVIGNVLLQAEMRRLRATDFRDRARQLLGSVGLAEFERRYPFELSGGMQQRAAFCRALVHDPSLVLMDEPLGALDALTREQLRTDLERLWMSTGKTLLFVTHSIAESVQLADRVVVMSPRPGLIEREVRVDLPRPRTIEVREGPEYHRYVHEITEVFLRRGVLTR